ncbi:hypothetical protein BD410DRAFT_795151 [Rickenella mellea]|uniref:Uncharacterized protein n=1 Tax=Rickenella mellea TaxID=50990 RepID=A0A4Y7PMK1_9AGAM|nr:hypothetical protein BD410DRAFT_795151 [Rickenella mellea]
MRVNGLMGVADTFGASLPVISIAWPADSVGLGGGGAPPRRALSGGLLGVAVAFGFMVLMMAVILASAPPTRTLSVC